jgi:hypothetical protein
MPSNRLTTVPILLIAAGSLIVGLAMPAAAHEAGHLINGATIKPHSIAGNRLKNNTLTGAQIKESTLGVVPKAAKAATIPALTWHPLLLDTNWAAEMGGRVPAYAVDAQGIVHLRGTLVSVNQTEPAFTLPVSVLSTATSFDIPMVSGTGSGSDACVLVVVAGHLTPTSNGQDCGGGEPDSLYYLDGITFADH